MEVTANGLNVALLHLNVRDSAELNGAFTAMVKEQVDAFAVIEDIVLIQNHKRIAESAVKQRLPSISFVEYAEAGGLFGYGANYLALYRRAAIFVDKILKGPNPPTFQSNDRRRSNLSSTCRPQRRSALPFHSRYYCAQTDKSNEKN